MDVRCPKCLTEYEFDDALVSARGTSVKCTQCGNQFRVHPEGGEGVEGDAWVVRRGDGEELVFNTLRALQQAIVRGQLAPVDVLTRPDAPGRPLSEIFELQSFFTESHRRRSLPPPRPGAGHSLPPPRSGQTRRFSPGELRSSGPPPRSGSELARLGQPGVAGPAPLTASAHEAESDGPTGNGAAEANSDAPASALAAALGADVVAEPVVDDTSPRQVVSSTPTLRPPEPTSLSSRLPPPPALPSPQALSEPSAEPATDPVQSVQPAPALPPWQSAAPEPPLQDSSSTARWLVALVVIGALGLLVGATFGERLMGPLSSSRNERAARLERLLRSARQDLRDGDFVSVRVGLAQAEALQVELEREPARPLKERWAELARAQAEQAWLRREALRLLGAMRETAGPGLARAEAELQTRLAELDQALLGLPPSRRARGEPLRARADILRMKGRPEEVRRLDPRWAQSVHPAAAAYSLAALDYAAGGSALTEAAERLRPLTPGARAEPGALLALVQWARGDALAAQRELAALEQAAPDSPLLIELRALIRPADAVGLTGGQGDSAATAVAAASAWGGLPSNPKKTEPKANPARDGKAAAPKVRSKPVVSEPPARRPVAKPRRTQQAAAATQPAAATPSPAKPTPSAYAQELKRAAALHSGGRLKEARSAYEALLSGRPNSVPALLGLAEVARQQGKRAEAKSLYERVLSREPGKVAALAALADLQWHAGDKAAAVARYRRVLARAGPNSALGVRALQRMDEYEAAQASADPPGKGAGSK